jgi:NAD(P)-dependent dehydrogenase (short-subunit alcohol dehydrogenase family)
MSPVKIISVVATKVNDHGAAYGSRAPVTNPKTWDQEKIMKLSNKIVLVTGGTSGIGLEAAKLFREEGATVIIVGHDPARLQAAASQLGDSITVLRGDVKKPAELENVVNQIREKFGRIDVLFANAGMGLPRLWKPSPKIKSTRNSM